MIRTCNFFAYFFLCHLFIFFSLTSLHHLCEENSSNTIKKLIKMAGTRLALIIIYSIQIVALFTLSYYQSIQYSNSTVQSKWSRIYHPFTTDRRGLSYLDSRVHRHDNNIKDSGDGEGRMSSLLDRIQSEAFDMNQIQFFQILNI